MIISCPACTTRYVVPDSAIGIEGRTVRCAKCKHSWFQDGPALDLLPSAEIEFEPAPAAPAPAPQTQGAAQPEQESGEPANPAPEPDLAKSATEFGGSFGGSDDVASAIPQGNDRSSDNPDAVDTDDDFEDPPVSENSLAQPEGEEFWENPEDDYSQFDSEPPFKGRRNPLRLWTYAAAIFALVAIGTVVAVSYWGVPDWVPVSRPTFAQAQPDLVLEFPPGKQDRRQLPNGTEFFGASGTVTNVGSETQVLPSILIILRDGRDRIVYSWEVPPPKRSLAPGESVTINEAVTDVPKAAKFAEIGWKPS